jgi:hypothetical protein
MHAATAITDAERTSADDSRKPFIDPSSAGGLWRPAGILLLEANARLDVNAITLSSVVNRSGRAGA